MHVLRVVCDPSVVYCKMYAVLAVLNFNQRDLAECLTGRKYMTFSLLLLVLVKDFPLSTEMV